MLLEHLLPFAARDAKKSNEELVKTACHCSIKLAPSRFPQPHLLKLHPG